ncbi:MAG: hypothetical protein K6F32_06770, partial [Bacilli bacterium]|nr:hypothetical protein [Bacilli bacterium]
MDLLLVDSQIKDLELEVKEGDTLRLNLASFHEFPTCKIQVNVRKNAVLDVAFADLGHGKGTFTFVANLEEGASAEFHASSLSSEKDNKVLDTSVHHLEP